MEEKSTLELVFMNRLDKKVTLVIPYPKETVTLTDVEAFAEHIIDKSLFGSNGYLVSLKEAYIRKVETTTLS